MAPAIRTFDRFSPRYTRRGNSLAAIIAPTRDDRAQVHAASLFAREQFRVTQSLSGGGGPNRQGKGLPSGEANW